MGSESAHLASSPSLSTIVLQFVVQRALSGSALRTNPIRRARKLPGGRRESRREAGLVSCTLRLPPAGLYDIRAPSASG